MVITRLCVFLFWAARDGYKPVVFAVYGGVVVFRGYMVFGAKGLFLAAACVLHAPSLMVALPEDRLSFELILCCFGWAFL
jgi:hypothetical protein